MQNPIDPFEDEEDERIMEMMDGGTTMDGQAEKNNLLLYAWIAVCVIVALVFAI